MNDAWQDVLTHTALADNQYAKVYRRHLEGDIERIVKRLAVAHDVVTLFDAL